MRIAILLLIHEYDAQQKMLVKNLSKDFDLYVHADKRSDIDTSELAAVSENVHAFKQYKVYWGSYNQIMATLFLFRMANEKKYDRYIFISGADLPIKPNAEIIRFFENTNKEYFDYTEFPKPEWTGGV